VYLAKPHPLQNIVGLSQPERQFRKIAKQLMKGPCGLAATKQAAAFCESAWWTISANRSSVHRKLIRAGGNIAAKNHRIMKTWW